MAPISMEQHIGGFLSAMMRVAELLHLQDLLIGSREDYNCEVGKNEGNSVASLSNGSTK